MSDITLYNTMTRRKERLEPVVPGKVSMYVCGPTVYDRAHIGNARAVVVFDVLFRLLRHTYGADNVTYVRNFTDVDDKINRRAAETRLPGETELAAIRRITDETIGWYHTDMDALGALRPTAEPRATEFIGQMVAMIETLIARGHAYVAEGHALFSVGSYPEYGALSRRTVDDMRAGARVEVAPYKRDPMDFVLWKPSDDVTPGWESPWGFGRPGWHIECSAMAKELLGLTFDIHGGGVDLAFPHHENELAQSRCAHPQGDFARIWMHNGMLNVEREKMSKSLGNFFTVRDLLDRGVPGEVIRFVLLSTHYRQPMDWNKERIDEAYGALRRWRGLTDGVTPSVVDLEFLKLLKNDLNFPGAFERLWQLYFSEDSEKLKASANIIGLLESSAGEWFRKENEFRSAAIKKLIEIRNAAKRERDFEKADGIRTELALAGIELRDLPGGVVRPRFSLDFLVNPGNTKYKAEIDSVIGAATNPEDGHIYADQIDTDLYLELISKRIIGSLR